MGRVGLATGDALWGECGAGTGDAVRVGAVELGIETALSGECGAGHCGGGSDLLGGGGREFWALGMPPGTGGITGLCVRDVLLFQCVTSCLDFHVIVFPSQLNYIFSVCCRCLEVL